MQRGDGRNLRTWAVIAAFVVALVGVVWSGIAAAAGAAAGEGPSLEQAGPAVDIEKATNGVDADTPTGPQILVGDPVAWTYVVTNTGDIDLMWVVVTDDQGVAVSCPQTSLAVGESMTCTASGVAVEGQYANVGTVDAFAANEAEVSDTDPSHYLGIPQAPAIDLEKATNGADADTPTGPQVWAGDPVAWTYEVANTGNVALSSVTVTDDQGVAVSCPQTSLAVGESMTCTAAGVAVEGQYANVGTASGTAPDLSVVSDTDPSHYYGTVAPAPEIAIDKAPDQQTLTLGVEDTATWTITVTNTGPAVLVNVNVLDPLAPDCDREIGDLGVGDSVSYTCSLSGVEAAFTNVASVRGRSAAGRTVAARDSAAVAMQLVVTGGSEAVRAGWWTPSLIGLGLVMVGFGLMLVSPARRARRGG